MNTSVLKFMIVFLGVFSVGTCGDDDGALPIDGGSYFDEVTCKLNTVFEKHTTYASDWSNMYTSGIEVSSAKATFCFTQGWDEGSGTSLSLSRCVVEKMGQATHEDVISDLYVDPVDQSLHPGLVTTYSLEPAKLSLTYNLSGAGAERTDARGGQVTLTVSGLRLLVAVAVVEGGSGVHTRFVHGHATSQGKLDSIQVKGTKIPHMEEAIRTVYGNSSQDFADLVARSFNIVIAQEFMQVDKKFYK